MTGTRPARIRPSHAAGHKPRDGRAGAGVPDPQPRLRQRQSKFKGGGRLRRSLTPVAFSTATPAAGGDGSISLRRQSARLLRIATSGASKRGAPLLVGATISIT
jgi:hypothetical protein